MLLIAFVGEEEDGETRKKEQKATGKEYLFGGERIASFQKNHLSIPGDVVSIYADCPIYMRILHEKHIARYLMDRGNYASIVSKDKRRLYEMISTVS